MRRARKGGDKGDSSPDRITERRQRAAALSRESTEQGTSDARLVAITCYDIIIPFVALLLSLTLSMRTAAHGSWPAGLLAVLSSA